MKILDFPDSRQSVEFSCGASALQSILLYYGIDRIENKIKKSIGSSPKSGSSITKIKEYIKDNGLKYASGKMSIEDIKSYINKNIPVLITIQAWKNKKVDYKKSWKNGHYVVAIGYDGDDIIFDDPSIHSRRGKLSSKELLKRWHDIDGNKKIENYGIAVFGKKPKFDKDKIIKIESEMMLLSLLNEVKKELKEK
jgi:hypothetical protein